MGLNDFSYSNEKNSVVKKYLVPKRVVTTKDAENAEWLLLDSPRQSLINSTGSCTLTPGGYVVLDFGCEFQGGIDLTVNFADKCEGADFPKVRIVFGESVTEAMSAIGDSMEAQNDHSTRDMTVHTTFMSTMRYGNTGFRFVKLEAVDCTLKIGVVKGVFEYKDIKYKGSFKCNDERLNKIFDTAAYTVHLNMQDYIWDGIKRDRLVWIGDMHPEVSTICSVFGYDECVEKSLDFSRDSSPIGEEKNDRIWMQFPSYSCWWITIHRDWYMQNGKLDYLLEQKDYMYKVCKNLIDGVDSDGNLDFGNQYFVDWSSNNTEYMEAGFRGCLIIGLRAAADIFEIYGDSDMAKKCLDTAENVRKIVPVFDGNKQTCAISLLSDLCDSKRANDIITKDLLEGLSTFYGYYVLCALEKAGNIDAALEIIRGYWGAMLDVGATTFWEDFDIKWMENAGRIDEIVPKDKVDIHGEYGKFCYQKLRHSLCHGWSSGPAAFLSRYVLGVQVVESGCKKVKIAPQLGDLKWVKGTYPTPYGVIKIEHKAVNGEVQTKVKAPKGVEVVY